MNLDYTYCLNEDTCIHRRGCKRWVGNYPSEEVKELANSYSDKYLDDEYCMKRHEIDDSLMPFNMLDRFRNSDGSDTNNA